jgi:hypothetical protein
MHSKFENVVRISTALLIFVASVPTAAFAQDAPPSVDASIDKLLQLDPAVVAAKLKEYEAQAAAWEAEAAKLRGEADAKQQQSDAITAQLEAIKSRVSALSALFSEAKPMDKAAPEGTMQIAKADMDAAPAVTFADHVLPIFQEKCAKCHNDDKQKGGLQVDNFEYLMEGGSSGEVIEPGNADNSRLFKLVTGAETPVMPPDGKGEPLSDEQIEVIRTWLSIGAPENSGSKIMLAKEESQEPAQMYVAADIVDGPPPMPEVAMPLLVDNPPRIPARAIASNPRSPLLAVAGYRQVMLYNLEDNAFLGALPFEEGEIHTLTFSVNGELLVAGGGAAGESGCAVVWQVRTGERLGKYGEGYDTVLATDISPDHRMIAIGGPNKSISVYSTANSKRMYKLEDHSDWIYAVKFTPDGEVLATADRAGGLFLWQAANGRAVEQLRGHDGAIHDLAYSADSMNLASAGADGTVRIWHTWEYKQIRSFNAHGGGTFSVDISPTNELVTTGRDQVLKRWDINGKELINYGTLPDWGFQARFGHAGAKVIAGAWDGEVAVWNTPAADRMATLTTATPGPIPTQVAAAATP